MPSISGLALVADHRPARRQRHRIFESLNNTGLRLTQGDLLRNYLFMRLPDPGGGRLPVPVAAVAGAAVQRRAGAAVLA